jgi:DNA-binding NtrC family response regulator
VRRELELAARTSSTVLLTGETGVGKGLAARWIHRSSDRGRQPFVQVDCAALAAGVIESELFGHERGAFTGAVQRRIGRFELAQGGSVFLDEIGELSAGLQAKLLRILEDREYERLGGGETRRMTARVLAASNRNLWACVREGRFRADLFYRLQVLEIRVPSLRERTPDIPLLVEQGLGRIARRMQRPLPRVRESFVQRLMAHEWPGNVRELMNLLERLMVRRADSEWDASTLAGELGRHPEGAGEAGCPVQPLRVGAPARELERDRLASVLEATGGNVAEAARLLGIPRSTLRYRLRQRGLSREAAPIASGDLGPPQRAGAEPSDDG